MAVFKLIDDHRKFKTLALMPDSLAEQLGDLELFEVLLDQPVENSSLKPIWGEVTAEFEDVLTKNSEVPDISIWCGLHLIFSPKAYDCLGERLSNCGEFLPITVSGEQWYFYTSQMFGKENTHLTVQKIEYGSVFGVERLVFDDEDIKHKLLFKSEMEGLTSLFCTDTLKGLVAEHQLTGIGFSEDLTGINFID